MFGDRVTGPISRWQRLELWLRTASPVVTSIATGVTAFATVIIMCATIVYSYYSARQWRTMRKEMRIAKSAADAATESANAEVAGIRAWIVFNGVELKQTGSTYHILMLYENAGKTPAIYGFTGSQYKLGKAPFREPGFDDCDKADTRKRGNSPPNIPFLNAGKPVPMDIPLSENESRELATRPPNVGYYIHECLRYSDVLTSTIEHLTEVCADVTTGSMCAHHNQVK
jgi:hypothetical protein